VTPSRIFVRLPNWLGDVMLARPLLHALRRSLPQARIAGVAPGALLELLAADGTLDQAHPWPREAEGRARVARDLKAFEPEVALILPPSFSSAWLAWRTGAKLRVGYAHEGRSMLLSRSERRPARGERHLADEYLHLGRDWYAATPRPAAVAPKLRLSEAASEAGREQRARLELEPRGYAVVAPGALYGPTKRWPAERFAAVGRWLAHRGLAVVACGVQAEAEACEQVVKGVGAGARSVAGRTSLPELAGLCSEARIAVCNDSGLAHLCAALGVPTVAVFGSTSSAWTAPLGPAVRVVQRPPACSPCFRPSCRIGIVCLTAVSERRVWRACEELLVEGAA
jgi:lipopolysaccharide heptosyltransferase II